MDSLSAKLLVASPRLTDPNFGRSVVLVIHHASDGAFGLVLNRPGPERLPAVWEQALQEPCRIDLPLYVGGPVEGPVVALHGDPRFSEEEVLPGLHFTRQRDHLLALVAEGGEALRVFAGYSGWGPGQLEGELARGDWGVVEATTLDVFGDDTTLWTGVSRRAADAALVRTIGVKHVPPRPWHN